MLIVALYNGEILLISGTVANSAGEILWSSASANFHARAVTRLRWIGSAEQRRELLSIGLDGKLLWSRLNFGSFLLINLFLFPKRLEPNNQLEALRSVQIALSDLPRGLRKSNLTTNRAVGLVDMAVLGDTILVGSEHFHSSLAIFYLQKKTKQIQAETGALLMLDRVELTVKEAIPLVDSIGLEQIAIVEAAPTGKTTMTDSDHGLDHAHQMDGNFVLIWCTSDGRIRKGILNKNATTIAGEQIQLLSTARCKQIGDFCIAPNNPLFLFALCEMDVEVQHSGISRELQSWDLTTGLGFDVIQYF